MCPRFAIRKGVKVLSRLDIMTPSRAQTVIDGLYRDVERRIAASPPGLCPVDLAMNFLNLCHAQTCGKCVPCRVGLAQLSDLMESVLDGKATMETIALIERTARVIVNSADCAIGRDAARLVLDGIQGFRDDYEEHVLRHRCLGGMQNPVPCVALCPAGVDIPGYTVLVKGVIFAAAGFMALTQLGIASKIVTYAFIGVLAALGIAFAVAFGIGGRDFAKKTLEKVSEKMEERVEK